MQFITFFLFIFLLDLYAFQAFVTVAQEWSEWSRVLLYSCYWFVPVSGLGFLWAIFSREILKWKKATFSTIRSVLMLAYFAKFLIILVLLFDDGRQLLMSLYEAVGGYQGFEYTRSIWWSQLAILVGVVPFFLLVYGILRNQYRYKIYQEKIPIPNLPDQLEGLKIVQISDIHSGSFTKKEPLKNAIDLINQQQADLVFFTGDLVNSIASEMDHFMDIFDKIESRYGVYSILGNHDYGDYVRWESRQAKDQNFEKLKTIHRQLGWDLMMNENRLLEINGEKVAVIGVENYSAHPRFPKYGNLTQAYQGADTAVLKLLLSHDPSHWKDEVLTKFKDIAITFSGHTHGFQFGIEIPGWFKWSPVKYVYKEWAGLYKKGTQFLYVNRGFGFLGYPGRVGILPEITVIELEGSQ